MVIVIYLVLSNVSWNHKLNNNIIIIVESMVEHISCLANKVSHKNIGLIFLLDANFKF